MKNLSQEQFYEIMTIIQRHLSNHSELLYHEYGYNNKLEYKLEELKNTIKHELQQITDLNDE